MDKYRKILQAVREKSEKEDRVKMAEVIAETMCLSVDESPYMIAMQPCIPCVWRMDSTL